MQIDTVIYYAIYDAKLYAYGAVNPISALANLAATTLRNIVGELELDGTLTSRDTINAKMTEILDEATDKWGIKVILALMVSRDVSVPSSSNSPTMLRSVVAARLASAEMGFTAP